MKKIVILLLVALGILSFGTTTMAEGSGANLYLDYSFMNWSPSLVNQKVNLLTLGADYNKEALALGGLYTTALSYDPAVSGASDNAFFVYGGYNVVQGDSSLAVIASYLTWNSKASGSSSDISSLGIGLRGAVNFDAGNISLLYSYGVSNSVTTGGIKYSGTVDASVLEVKGVFYLNEKVGMHAVYRSIPFKTVISTTFSGFGLGVDFKI